MKLYNPDITSSPLSVSLDRNNMRILSNSCSSIFALLLCVALTQVAIAQEPMLPLEESKAEEKLEKPNDAKSLKTSRDQLYQQILVDAARIEAQGNLLKRVVKFV